MSLPAITITETRDSTTTRDYPHLPPPQDDSNLKIRGSLCLSSLQDDSSEKVSSAVSSPGSRKHQEEEDKGELEEDKEFDPTIGAKPYSPFFRHASPSTPFELPSLHRQKPSRGVQAQNPNVIDLESGNQSRLAPGNQNTNRPRSSLLSLFPRRKKQTLRSKLWAGERPKEGILHKLSEKQRFAVKIVVAVVTLGGMVGIALGITSAVGANSWSERDPTLERQN